MCFQGGELLQKGIVQYSEVLKLLETSWWPGRGQDLPLFRNEENYALRLCFKARQIIKACSRRRGAVFNLPIACGVGRARGRAGSGQAM